MECFSSLLVLLLSVLFLTYWKFPIIELGRTCGLGAALPCSFQWGENKSPMRIAVGGCWLEEGGKQQKGVLPTQCVNCGARPVG